MHGVASTWSVAWRDQSSFGGSLPRLFLTGSRSRQIRRPSLSSWYPSPQTRYRAAGGAPFSGGSTHTTGEEKIALSVEFSSLSPVHFPASAPVSASTQQIAPFEPDRMELLPTP